MVKKKKILMCKDIVIGEMVFKWELIWVVKNKENEVLFDLIGKKLGWGVYVVVSVVVV